MLFFMFPTAAVLNVPVGMSLGCRAMHTRWGVSPNLGRWNGGAIHFVKISCIKRENSNIKHITIYIK
jgi:hypothetical protein